VSVFSFFRTGIGGMGEHRFFCPILSSAAEPSLVLGRFVGGGVVHVHMAVRCCPLHFHYNPSTVTLQMRDVGGIRPEY
jgi:hypothetical protein